MAPGTLRHVASLLSRPSSQQCLRLAPRRQSIWSASSAERCLHQQAKWQKDTESIVEPKTGPLEYTRRRRVTNTRPQPRAPYPVRNIKPYEVNDDPVRLDEMYEKLLGSHIRLRLDEEVKWQAITHKSFDHGRQPFNEKLAFLGRRIMYFHAAIHLLNAPKTTIPTSSPEPRVYESLEGVPYLAPEPYTDESYRSLESVTSQNIADLTKSANLEQLTRLVGIQEVMRWQPADENDMQRSSQNKIAIQCLFAIVGAVALQSGGDAASRVVMNRILADIRKDY